ncbi:MAG TPA: hypothetical protein VEA99_08985 [Gemmatimonadaceae bacterium]|nr:hypothetical protein [Gemmatimonadaceae bacterium]
MRPPSRSARAAPLSLLRRAPWHDGEGLLREQEPIRLDPIVPTWTAEPSCIRRLAERTAAGGTYANAVTPFAVAGISPEASCTASSPLASQPDSSGAMAAS